MQRDIDRFLDEPGIAAKAGMIATRLGHGLPRAVSRKDALLQRALAYAAMAEQRLAEQAEHVAYLESLTATDELTGLLNRRGFIQALEQGLARARRFGETGVVCYLDLDGFKAINDRLGHAAGDEVLRETARLLAATVREVDTAARIGGDEFAVILVHIRRRDGLERARALEARLEAVSVSYGGQFIPVRATVGAEAFGAGDTALDVLARADTAMYELKRRKTARADAAAEPAV